MKKAILTGASSGLGHEIASQLVKKGVEVINLSRSPSDLPVVNITTDLTRNADITAAVRVIRDEHQDADVLILCAGVLHWHSIGEIPMEDVDNDFAVNVLSVVKLANGIMPLIKKNRGDVAVIGSTSSFKSYPESAVYSATKHAVLGFVKSLQAEFKQDDLRVIGFYPGGFKSRLHINAESETRQGIRQEDLMDPEYLAGLLISILELPRNMEVSEIIINRKKAQQGD